MLKFWRCTNVMSDEYGSYEYRQEEGLEQPELGKIHPVDTGA